MWSQIQRCRVLSHCTKRIHRQYCRQFNQYGVATCNQTHAEMNKYCTALCNGRASVCPEIVSLQYPVTPVWTTNRCVARWCDVIDLSRRPNSRLYPRGSTFSWTELCSGLFPQNFTNSVLVRAGIPLIGSCFSNQRNSAELHLICVRLQISALNTLFHGT
jgi:hypothetical protein